MHCRCMCRPTTRPRYSIQAPACGQHTYTHCINPVAQTLSTQNPSQLCALPLWGPLCDADQHTPLGIRADPVADNLRATEVGSAVKHLDRRLGSTLHRFEHTEHTEAAHRSAGCLAYCACCTAADRACQACYNAPAAAATVAVLFGNHCCTKRKTQLRCKALLWQQGADTRTWMSQW